jgi:MOSC domain-containing protein YiiM
MTGTIIQISISRGGVPKRAIAEGMVTPLGLEGDVQAHPHIHGGPRQAILIICAEVIDELISRGYPLFYGALGENFTTRGLDCREMRAGQRYRAGQALIEITKVRAPCSTIAQYGATLGKEIYDSEVKAGNPKSPRWGMAGFYASVLRPGEVRQNDIIALIDQVA